MIIEKMLKLPRWIEAKAQSCDYNEIYAFYGFQIFNDVDNQIRLGYFNNNVNPPILFLIENILNDRDLDVALNECQSWVDGEYPNQK